MSKKRLVITEDITDWKDECLREEVAIGSVDDLTELVTEHRYSTAQAARFAIVLRAMEAAPDDVLRSNKVLLNAAARAEVGARVQACKVEAESPNGKTWFVRTYIAAPGHKPDLDGEEEGMALNKEAIGIEDESGFVQFDTERGLELAAHYLTHVVPGHVFERLKQIAAASGDVEKAAHVLKNKIDELVERLV